LNSCYSYFSDNRITNSTVGYPKAKIGWLNRIFTGRNTGFQRVRELRGFGKLQEFLNWLKVRDQEIIS